MQTITTPRVSHLEAQAAYAGLVDLIANLSGAGRALHGGVVPAHLIDFTVVADATGAKRVANEIKAAFNLHLAEYAISHVSADATTAVIASAAATNTATTTAILNEAKAQINLHVRRAPEHRPLPAADLVTATDGSDDASNIVLANDILGVWRRHVYSAAPSYILTSV